MASPNQIQRAVTLQIDPRFLLVENHVKRAQNGACK